MKLQLTMACNQCDRSIPLQDGSVAVEGVQLRILPMLPGEIFRRQVRHAEFDVAEFSLSTYSMIHARGDRRFIAIPVFPSRVFRHGDIFVNRDVVRQPQDLVGKSVGVQEYQQTACVWMRGILQHEYGVAPDAMEWCLGGFNAAENFTERAETHLPQRFRTRNVGSSVSLSDLLARGEIAAAMGANAPDCFSRGAPGVERLIADYAEVEVEFYRRTRIFPIMHLVVVRRDVYERDPWVAASLFKAWVQAKRIGYDRMRRHGALYASLPWLWKHVEETERTLGSDLWAYGLAPNRHVIETFLRYSREQGLIEQPPTVEELFAPSTHDLDEDSVG